MAVVILEGSVDSKPLLPFRWDCPSHTPPLSALCHCSDGLQQCNPIRWSILGRVLRRHSKGRPNVEHTFNLIHDRGAQAIRNVPGHSWRRDESGKVSGQSKEATSSVCA